jgi:hypothetical protein
MCALDRILRVSVSTLEGGARITMKVLVAKQVFLKCGCSEVGDAFTLLSMSIENARQKFASIRTGHKSILVLVCTLAEAL